MRPKILADLRYSSRFSLSAISTLWRCSRRWLRYGAWKVKPIMPAANAYLDAYAVGTSGAGPLAGRLDQLGHFAGSPVSAINTMRVAAGKAKPQALNFGLLTAEGVRAFKQALVAQHAQVIARKEPLAPGMAAGAGRCRSAHRRFGAVEGGGRCERRAAAQHAKPIHVPHSRGPIATARKRIANGARPAMWIDFLRTSPIGLDDNFFELGGHSLMALQLLPRIREKYQIALEPREFFANASIGKIAALIEDKLLTEIEEMSKQGLSKEAARTAAE